MELGLIGLGKMGFNMAERLRERLASVSQEEIRILALGRNTWASDKNQMKKVRRARGSPDFSGILERNGELHASCRSAVLNVCIYVSSEYLLCLSRRWSFRLS